MSAAAKAFERPRPTPASPRPGRKVQRARSRNAGTFQRGAKHMRLVRRFGVKGARAYVPSVPVVNEHKDRTLAGKARRDARKAARR